MTASAARASAFYAEVTAHGAVWESEKPVRSLDSAHSPEDDSTITRAEAGARLMIAPSRVTDLVFQGI